MFETIRRSFPAAVVTGALTALSVTLLTALAENDAAHEGALRARPAATTPAWPQSGTVRVIDLRRAPVVPSPRAAERDRGAA